MQKKEILFLMSLLVLFLSPFVVAQPPVQSQGDVGYIIKYPADSNLKVNTDYDFSFHVHNSTNGLAVLSGVSCYFHLYNNSGDHVLELFQNETTHNIDFEFLVLGGNLSAIGEYHYNIYCNSSEFGGFDTVYFRVTGSGLETNNIVEAIGTYSPSIALLLLFVFFIVLSFSVRNPTLKILYLCLSVVLLFFAILYIGVTMGRTTVDSSLLSSMEIFMSVFSSLFYAFFVLVVIAGLVVIFKGIKDSIKMKRGFD